MKSLILLCLFLLACGGAASSEADTLPVWIIYHRGVRAASVDTILAAMADVTETWNSSGIPIKLELRKFIYSKDNPCRRFLTLDSFTFGGLYQCTSRENMRLGYLSKRRVVVAVEPPVAGNGWWWQAGQANRGSFRRWDSNVLVACSRLAACKTILMHELLHTVGASHTDDCSIMNAGASSCINSAGDIPQISEATVLDVSNFLGR